KPSHQIPAVEKPVEPPPRASWRAGEGQIEKDGPPEKRGRSGLIRQLPDGQQTRHQGDSTHQPQVIENPVLLSVQSAADGHEHLGASALDAIGNPLSAPAPKQLSNSRSAPHRFPVDGDEDVSRSKATPAPGTSGSDPVRHHAPLAIRPEDAVLTVEGGGSIEKATDADKKKEQESGEDPGSADRGN